jgi:glycosyltransferase involved in cell wall biosynthesis
MTTGARSAPAGRSEAAGRRIAVLVPCLDEERTIGAVVRAFRAELPGAEIYVYDNGSRDRTAEEARAAGAIVRREPRRGKGTVVRTMFREVDADVYVLVDGDATYPAERVHDLLAPVLAGEADMVNGSRLLSGTSAGFRTGNLWANRAFVRILNSIFGVRLTDLLSGYRAFNRIAVKSLPLVSRGFEIETELTLKAIERDLRIVEVPVTLSERPDGSHSKIVRFRDGRLILATILALFRDYKPLTLFGALGLLFVAAGLVPGGIVIDEFLRTGLVLHFPSAILAVGLVLTGVVLGFTGLVLHAVARRFQEHDRVMRTLLEAVERRIDDER